MVPVFLANGLINQAIVNDSRETETHGMCRLCEFSLEGFTHFRWFGIMSSDNDPGRSLFKLASEYLLKKYKDVKPDEPIVLTKQEKRKNWWHYHKWYVLGGVFLAAVIISFVSEVVSKKEPDYQIAYVGQYALPFGVDDEILHRLEQIADDRNGDGRVTVLFNSFAINEMDPTAYASQVALVGDITLGSSEFFIVADPMEAQKQFGIFIQEDGTLPEDGTDVQSCMSIAWSDCDAMKDIDLGLDTEFYLIRRGYVSEEMIAEHDGSDVFWEALIAGVE